MKMQSFDNQIVIGKRALMLVDSPIVVGVPLVIEAKILLYAKDSVIGEVVLNAGALEFLKSGGKIKAKSVSQFKKEIK